MFLLIVTVGLSEPAYTSPKDYKLELSNNEKVLVRKDKEPIKISFTQNLSILKGIYVRSKIKPGKSNNTIREEKIKREEVARLRALQAQRMESLRNKTVVSTPRSSNRNSNWYPIILLAAHKYSVSAEDLYRVMTCESGGNRFAHNASGARGLFQFMPSTWASTPYARYSIWDGEKQCYAAAWMFSVGRKGEWVCK